MSAHASKFQSANRPPYPPRADEVLKEVILANGAIRQERYDFLGKLLLRKEPDGSWLRFRYDAMGRLQRAEHSSGECVEYRIEKHLWSARTLRTETTIHLSKEGHPLKVVTRVDDHEWSVSYRRDKEGRIEACLYPESPEWLVIERSADDRLRVACAANEYCRVWTDEQQRKITLKFVNGAQTFEELSEEKSTRPTRSIFSNGDGSVALDVPFTFDTEGRLTSAGQQSFTYDEEKRLRAFVSNGVEHLYEYDERGRLLRGGAESKQFHYTDSPAIDHLDNADGTKISFTYDALGRRIARRATEGETLYAYDFFNQLTRVWLPEGGEINYIYDGFGRLVGREVDGEVSYFINGFEGQRLAEADASGFVRESYLWLGAQCVGRIKGVVGEPLTSSFHRIHGGRLAGIGNDAGSIRLLKTDDPYGADALVEQGIAGFQNLFGEPLTGLLFAGTRWLDPTVAQFLTPDSWFGEDPRRMMPRELRSVIDALPGGTDCQLSPEAAYAWCAYDPVNYTDTNGHSPGWYVWSFFSAFLWETQLTGIAIQMEAINILLEPFTWIIGGLKYGASSAWKFSIFNLAVPMAFKQQIPYALPLNGLLRFHDRGWTLGNVIWVRGDKWRAVEKTGKGDLLICENAKDYLAATNQATGNVWLTRNTFISANGNVPAANDKQITGVALTQPAPPPAPNQVFKFDDWISIKVAAVARDEIRQIKTVSAGGATLDLNRSLPASFVGQAVTFTRLDPSMVKMEKDGKTRARTIVIVRGDAIHYAKQIIEGFPTEGLKATEYISAPVRMRNNNVPFPVERVLLRLASDADLNGYAAGNFIRITAGNSYLAAEVKRTHGTKELVISPEVSGAITSGLEIERLDASGGPQNIPGIINDPAGNATRFKATGLAGLALKDGVEIKDSAATPAVVKRIVTQFGLDCALFSALPPELRNVDIKIDLMVNDPSVQAQGKVKATRFHVECAAPDQAKKFKAKQNVKVSMTGQPDAAAVVDSIDEATNHIVFKESLPAAFADESNVTVTLLKETLEFDAEKVAPPGDHVLVKVTAGTELTQTSIIRVRHASDSDIKVLRAMSAAPDLVAELNAAVTGLTGAITAARFTTGPPPSTKRTGVEAPPVRVRLTFGAPPSPWAVGNELFIQANWQTPDNDPLSEEAWGKVATVEAHSVTLEDPVEFADNPPGVFVQIIIPTGKTTDNAHLDEGRILVPADPEMQLTRREAFEYHEMRHVFQGALYGPFLLSLPLPWLFAMGFSTGRLANSASSVARHISVGGGLTSLLALAVWGVSGAHGATTLEGTVTGAGHKEITFSSDADGKSVERYSDGSYLSVEKDDKNVFNIVEKLDAAAKKLTLRFALEDKQFATNDKVKVSVSSFEEIRKIISRSFAMNFEQLWSDHIPVAWGRALSKFLNSDYWFPLGMYPLSLIFAGFNENRLPNEQDAAFHSGDLYSNILLSKPPEIFVGQFTAIYAFIHPRAYPRGDEGNVARGIADIGPVNILTVALPAPSGAVTSQQIADQVNGADFDGASEISFREDWLIQMDDRIENAVGAFFSSSFPGTYTLKCQGNTNQDNIICGVFFDVEFLKLGKVVVKELNIRTIPAEVVLDAGKYKIFETEKITFEIIGAKGVTYSLRFDPKGAGNQGTLNALSYQSPVFPAATHQVVQKVQVIVTYPPNHPVFLGPGQKAATKLKADQLVNLCQELTLQIDELKAPVLGTVKAGTKKDFEMPIAPIGKPEVTSNLPAGATTKGSVLNKGGRPAKLTFIAPDHVTAATDITFEMNFGVNPNNKKVTTTVRVEP